MRIARCLIGFAFALGAFAQPASSPDLYYLVFLRPNPARKALSKEDGTRIQSAHMANIQALAASGVMVAAGPFENHEPPISGVFVFQQGPKSATLEEARRLAAQDPTVVEHRNTVDVYAWHGPRGIGEEYARLHKADPKTPDDMGIHPFLMLYRGSAWDPRSPLITAHNEYLQNLRRQGKLATSGVVDANDSGLEAIAVFQRLPAAEARNLMQNDPAVKAGVYRSEYHGWWCAANVLPQARQM